MNNEIIVSSIKNLCKSNNITVGELEKTIGLSQGLVSKWLKTTPSLDKIVDIADYFHVSLDEVVGRNQCNISDMFLKILYEKTNEKQIKWYSNLDKYCPMVKISYDETLEGNFNQISYYSEYNNGYIIIYCIYTPDFLLAPRELKLYIQPSYNSDRIIQDYSTEELKMLWVKILNNLDNVPDEVKAQDFKNSFINENLSKENRQDYFPSYFEKVNEVNPSKEKKSDSLENQVLFTELFDEDNKK